MDPNHFRLYIVRDALKTANWWSPAIENLLVGTAMVETGLEKLVQEPVSHAKGVYQFEDRSYLDVLNYIKRDADKVKAILTACHMSDFPDIDGMIWNLRYATLIARMFYYRIPEALPKSEDAEGLANYYIRFYNCGGKATIERDLPIFQQVCSYKD